MAARKHRASDAWGLTKLKQAVARDLQMAIRLEAADDWGVCECVTCGTYKHYKEMHAGHFIAGRTNSILFDERNIHPQCNRCNTFFYGNQVKYVPYMLKRYGEKVVDELQANKFKTMTFTRDELNEMRDGYKARIKAQKGRIRVH